MKKIRIKKIIKLVIVISVKFKVERIFYFVDELWNLFSDGFMWRVIIFIEFGVFEEIVKIVWDRMVFLFDFVGVSFILYNNEMFLVS